MGSTKRILGRKLNYLRPTAPVYGERLARLVTRKIRFGKGIKLHQLSSVPHGVIERQLLDEYEKKIKELRPRADYTKRLRSLESKAQVLRSVVHLQQKLGGRKPTVYQVLALPALEFGLDSEVLKQKAKDVATLSHRYKERLPFVGTGVAAILSHLTRHSPPSSKKNIISAIEDALASRAKDPNNQFMVSEEIAHAVGIDWKLRKSYVNLALQFLEICGLVRKMPSAALQKSQSVWVHASIHTPRVSYPNVKMDLLRQLHSGEKIYLRMTSDKKGEKFTMHAVRDGLGELVRAGLVKVVHGGYTYHPMPHMTATTKSYHLTKQGKNLYRQYLRIGYLPESLRLLLLGEKEEA